MAVYQLVTGNILSVGSGTLTLPTDTYAVENDINFSNTTSLTKRATPGLNRVIFIRANSYLHLTQTGYNKVKTVRVNQYIDIHQQASRPIQLFATSVIQFADTGRKVNLQVSSTTLNLAQIAGYGRGLQANLALVSTVGVLKVLGLSVSNTFAPQSNSASWIPSYPITQGPCPVTPNFTNVTLTNGTIIFTLGIPEFGDTDSIELARIQRNSRAGDLIIYRDPVWPVTEKLKLTFTNFSQLKAKQYLNFLDQTLGQEMTLVDHWGRSWVGVIITPESPIAQQGPDSGVICGGFNCEFEFMGNKT